MPHPTWLKLGLFAAATRIATVVIGYLLNTYCGPIPWLVGVSNHDRSLVEAFQRWDAIHYLEIAADGYRYNPATGGTSAFMPALPTIIAVAAKLGGDPLAFSLLIPNVCFVVGLMFFGRYLAERTRDTRLAWRACILLAAYPAAFFFSCPYQESIGFAGISIALWAWQRQRTGLAAAGVFVASFARLTALAFPAGLALEWLLARLRGRSTRPLSSVILVSLAWLVAIGLFAAYFWHLFGDPLAHVKSHRFWDRKPPNPLNIGLTLRIIAEDWLIHGPSQQGLSLALFTFLGVRAWLRRGAFDGVLILLPLVQAASTGTPMSLERIVLASFPAFLDLAELLNTRWRFGIGIAISLGLQVIMLNGYVHWQFMG